MASEIELELQSLAQEREWFASQIETMLVQTLSRLNSCLSHIGKSAIARPSDMLLPRMEREEASPIAKAPTMSVDDILAQARGGAKPKAKEEPKSSGNDNSDSDGEHGSGSKGAPKAKKKREATSLGPGEVDRMLSFKAGDNSFSGFVVLQGWNCIEAELMVQFQNHHRNASNGTYEIEIRSSRPWRFAQLQNCYLHIEEAIELCSLHDQTMLHAALSAVVCAQEELISPQTRSFPADSRVFHPRLPADVLVDFCVVNCELQAQAVLVRAVNSRENSRDKDSRLQPQPLSLAQLKPGDQFSLAPGKLVEVLELSRVECELPNLDKCFTLLGKTINMLNAAIHNYEALNGLSNC